MIGLYVGLPRMGKTLHLAERVALMLRYGRRVISNTPFWTYIKGRKVSAEFYDDRERFTFELLHAKSAAVIIDEISLVFSSLRWNKLDLDLFGKFRQAGKQSCDMFGTTQSWTDTISSIRRVTDVCYYCFKHRWLFRRPIADFSHERYNEARKCYEITGAVIATPYVYEMWTVNKGYFGSRAEIAKNREIYVLKKTMMYPSQFRRISKCYDHGYEITFSLVGNLSMFGKYETWNDYVAAKAAKTTRTVNGKAVQPSVVVNETTRPVASATPLSG